MHGKSALICLGVVFAIFSSRISALDGTRPHSPRPADIEGRQWLILNYFIGKEEIWLSGLRKVGQERDAFINFKSGVIEGSSGCGKFTGTYHRSGGRLTILAEWADVAEGSCDSDLRKHAEQLVRTLNNVRGIQVAPPESHSDVLVLTDAKGSTQVMLEPTQPGKDLSELQNTFWHLTKLEGTHADLSGVAIEIEKRGVTFSTVSYATGVFFEYKFSRLEFPPTTPLVQSSNNRQSWRDQHIAKLFADAFRQTNSYRLREGNLTFFGLAQESLFVLTPLQQEGIENRRWHIAKYRGDGSPHADAEGLVDAVEPADITFLNGRVGGWTGCGAWFGTYRVADDHVTVQAGAILGGACNPAGYRQGPLVVEAFKGELQIEKKGDHIQLRDLAGKARILLVPY